MLMPTVNRSTLNFPVVNALPVGGNFEHADKLSKIEARTSDPTWGRILFAPFIVIFGSGLARGEDTSQKDGSSAYGNATGHERPET